MSFGALRSPQVPAISKLCNSLGLWQSQIAALGAIWRRIGFEAPGCGRYSSIILVGLAAPHTTFATRNAAAPVSAALAARQLGPSLVTAPRTLKFPWARAAGNPDQPTPQTPKWSQAELRQSASHSQAGLILSITSQETHAEARPKKVKIFFQKGFQRFQSPHGHRILEQKDDNC